MVPKRSRRWFPLEFKFQLPIAGIIQLVESYDKRTNYRLTFGLAQVDELVGQLGYVLTFLLVRVGQYAKRLRFRSFFGGLGMDLVRLVVVCMSLRFVGLEQGLACWPLS